MIKREEKYLEEIVNEVIDKETKALLEIQGGSRSSLEKLVNQVVKKSGRKVNPNQVRRIILNKF